MDLQTFMLLSANNARHPLVLMMFLFHSAHALGHAEADICLIKLLRETRRG